MNKKIRVLQLVEGLNLGGAETKLLELVSKMDSSRFETIFCSLGMGDRLREEVEKLDVEYIAFSRKRKIDPSLIFKVADLIKKKQIDVVMTTLFYADVIGALAGRLSPAKAVFSWETISAPEWLVKHRLWAYRFAMHFCDKVVSVSEATARWLVDKRGVPAQKVKVIPYGVNLDEFQAGKNQELRETLGIEEDVMVVGTVARLHPQKGHCYLIEAATGIIAQHPRTKFVFVGDGPLRGELEGMVEDRSLSANFLFLGFRNDVNQLLGIFDIFVLPSLYEGLPNVILEAMATGLPVIATAVDGSPELVVDGETGFLVPPEKPDALREKISLLLASPKIISEFGRQGRRRVEDNFSLELQVKNFQDLYESYVSNGKHN